jgi:hypothetical protein
MELDDVLEVLNKPDSAALLRSSIPARLAYIGLDGGPRAIPIAFWWTGETFLVFTVPASAKVAALQADPRVALTIDTQDGWPPRALLVRGTARVDEVEGVAPEYVEASRKVVPADSFADWEAGVRALYERQARITITPHWAKLIDFETTIPKAVEDLARSRGLA